MPAVSVNNRLVLLCIFAISLYSRSKHDRTSADDDINIDIDSLESVDLPRSPEERDDEDQRNAELFSTALSDLSEAKSALGEEGHHQQAHRVQEDVENENGIGNDEEEEQEQEEDMDNGVADNATKPEHDGTDVDHDIDDGNDNDDDDDDDDDVDVDSTQDEKLGLLKESQGHDEDDDPQDYSRYALHHALG